MAGKYDPEVVSFIADQILESILDAEKNLCSSKIGFESIHVPQLVENRLVPNEADVEDPYLRVLKMVSECQGTAVLSSFAAHSTCLFKDNMLLSGDYPSMLNLKLESDSSVDFSLFAAGAMASMRPSHPHGIRKYEKLEYVSDTLKEVLVQKVPTISAEEVFQIGHDEIPINMPEPAFRVSNSLQLRPWVFDLLMGRSEVYVKSFQVGNTLFVGLPCDFSGELMAPLDDEANQSKLNLVVNSFNGGYVGYITRDDRYHLNKYETRMMNWFGPYMGKFFSQLVSNTIHLHKATDHENE